MAPVGVPVRVHEGGAQFSKKDKRERRSLDLDPSQRRQNTDGSGDREGVDKPDTPQPFGSRSPLPKRLKMRLERPEVPAEDIAARVDARLAAAERKREEEALEHTRAKARALGSLRVRRAAATRARQETELAERHRRKMETAAANRESFLERRRDIARRLAAGAHSPSTKHSRTDDAAADAIRRAWLRFRRDGDTTEAVASRYRALGLSEVTALASDDFDAFAGMLSNPHTLRTTRAMLNRAQHRLAARGRDPGSDPAHGALVRRFVAPKSADENNADGCLDRRESLDSADEAFPTRVVLCAYMVTAHPATVLSPHELLPEDTEDTGEDTKEPKWGGVDGVLKKSAAKLVSAVDAMVSDSDDGPMSRRHVDEFVAAWDPYLEDFCAWKVHDAAALERDLVAAAVALEESHLRTCGTDRTVPFHPSSDEAAVRDACENDKALLRSKVEALGGGEALGRFDQAMAAALSRVEAEEDAAAAAEDDAASDAEGADPGADTAVTQTHPGEASQARRRERAARRVEARAAMREARVAAYASRRAEHGIKPSIGVKPSRPIDSNRTAIGGKTNEALMHELLIDPDWRLAKSRTHPADSTGKPAPISDAENSVEARVREQMERAFWAQAVESMSTIRDGDCALDVNRPLALVAELRSELRSLCPEHVRGAAEVVALDSLRDDAIAPALRTAAKDPEGAGAVLGEALRGAVAMIRRFESPSASNDASRRADEIVKGLTEKTDAAVDASRRGDFKSAAKSMAQAVVDSLRFCFTELRVVQRDCGNAALATLSPLAKGAEGVRWARHRFAIRRDLPEPSSHFDAEGREKVDVDAAIATRALPRTRAWLAGNVSLAHAADAALPKLPNADDWRRDRHRVNAPRPGDPVPGTFPTHAGSPTGTGKPGSPTGTSGSPTSGSPAPPVSIRTGRVHGATPKSSKGPSEGERRSLKEKVDAAVLAQAWTPTNACTPEGIARVALASLIADPNPHAPERLPETLEFDAERLATLQNDFQRVAVSAACVRVARMRIRLRTNDQRATARDLPDFCRRLDVLLADPTVRVPDLAAEIAAQVARSASLDATEQAPVVAESAELQAAERELRGLTDPAASGGAALLDGVRSALATRLLLGPDIVSATGGNGSDGATAAAALSRSLAACGVDGEIGVAVAGDLKALAAGAMRSIGRVNWLVHGPIYESMGADLLAKDDEL